MTASDVVFCVPSSGPDGRVSAELLVATLRAFGGELSRAPVWLLDPAVGVEEEAAEGARRVPLRTETFRGYVFGDKVAGCAQAEERAAGTCRTLIWMAPQCLVLRGPVLLRLNGEEGAALRPVHIRNVGSPVEEAPDDYWEGVYRLTGTSPPTFSVRSQVDRRTIRPYYNTHLFAIDPSLGLMKRWRDTFAEAVADARFQSGPCADDLHRIFLHQALLSALVAGQLGEQRVRTLPATYSYPLHLHDDLPDGERAESLDDLVCPVYEGPFDAQETLSGLVVPPLFAALLRSRADRSLTS